MDKQELLAYVRVVYRRALKAFPLYTSKYSKRKFSQPQLAACVLLGDYLQLDFRELERFLDEEAGVREVLELEEAPDHTTLSRHAGRRAEEFSLQRIGDGPSFIVAPSAL